MCYCGGPHSAKSNKCPRMIEEMNIQNVKTTEKISYSEARRKVCGPKGTNRATYAQVSSSDSQTIIQNLIPNITKIIKEQIQLVINTLSNDPNKSSQPSSSQTSSMRPPEPVDLTRSGSTTDASQNKRKRSQANNSAADDTFESDDSLFSSQASDIPKKKATNGRRGRPRKNQTGHQSSSQMEVSQPPG